MPSVGVLDGVGLVLPSVEVELLASGREEVGLGLIDAVPVAGAFARARRGLRLLMRLIGERCSFRCSCAAMTRVGMMTRHLAPGTAQHLGDAPRWGRGGLSGQVARSRYIVVDAGDGGGTDNARRRGLRRGGLVGQAHDAILRSKGPGAVRR